MIDGAFGIIYAALTGDQQNVDFIAQPRGTQKIPLADRGVQEAEEEEVTVVPVPFASHSLSQWSGVPRPWQLTGWIYAQPEKFISGSTLS